jgi:hypothetical protein
MQMETAMNETPAQQAVNLFGLVAYLFVVGGEWSPLGAPPPSIERYEQRTVDRPSKTSTSRRKAAAA